MLKDKELFKSACVKCFGKVGLNELRVYGRSIGMRAATKLAKDDLIREIAGILCGEISPCPTTRGAPAKSYAPDPIFVQVVENLKKAYGFSNRRDEAGVYIENADSKSQEREKRIVIKDTMGKSVSFGGDDLKFEIVIGGTMRLKQGETYTISLEEFDK